MTIYISRYFRVLCRGVLLLIMLVFLCVESGAQVHAISSMDSVSVIGQLKSEYTNLVIAYGTLIDADDEDYITIAKELMGSQAIEKDEKEI